MVILIADNDLRCGVVGVREAYELCTGLVHRHAGDSAVDAVLADRGGDSVEIGFDNDKLLAELCGDKGGDLYINACDLVADGEFKGSKGSVCGKYKLILAFVYGAVIKGIAVPVCGVAAEIGVLFDNFIDIDLGKRGIDLVKKLGLSLVHGYRVKLFAAERDIDHLDTACGGDDVLCNVAVDNDIIKVSGFEIRNRKRAGLVSLAFEVGEAFEIPIGIAHNVVETGGAGLGAEFVSGSLRGGAAVPGGASGGGAFVFVFVAGGQPGAGYNCGEHKQYSKQFFHFGVFLSGVGFVDVGIITHKYAHVNRIFAKIFNKSG